ncbi:MAG: hypothetical protein V5A55_09115 [Halovenus sp.]
MASDAPDPRLESLDIYLCIFIGATKELTAQANVPLRVVLEQFDVGFAPPETIGRSRAESSRPVGDDARHWIGRVQRPLPGSDILPHTAQMCSYVRCPLADLAEPILTIAGVFAVTILWW